jgi:CRP/FNR family cyclic AMP-dependent transcriptional regulator
MNPHELASEVAAIPFLKGMSDQHIRVLADSSCRIHIEKGATIFRQGETANRFYLIECGDVILEAASKSGKRHVIAGTIRSGGVLGWSWLFDPYEWQFTARALTEIRAIFFYATILREQCETDPSLGFELLKRMSAAMVHRLQSTRNHLLETESGVSPVEAEHAMSGV